MIFLPSLAFLNGRTIVVYPMIKPPDKIILKLARRADFLGLPLGWLGRAICQHERSILKRLQHLPQIPHLMGRYRDMGLIYEYIEGITLDEYPTLPDDFFFRLEVLVIQIHACHIAYVDMNKRGNILLGLDNLPYLIDFQIAYHIECPMWGLRSLTGFILEILQKEDFYHILKHKRRLSRHLMDAEQIIASRRKSRWIRAYRKLTRPLTKLRRRILHFLFRTGHLVSDDASMKSRESNPDRWEKPSSCKR